MENQNHDEIDLLKLLDTLWHGKWKILSFLIIPVAVLFIYKTYNPKIFTATTSIFPLSQEVVQKYKILSLSPLISFTSDELYNNFILKLQDEVVLREAIVKSNLLKIENYENEKKYMEAVSNLAFKIKITSPKVMFKPLAGETVSKFKINEYPTITFNYDNEIKWIKTLSVLNSIANQKVKEDIDITLQTIINVKNLDLEIKKKMTQLEISNLFSDYDRITKDRLLYLEEQARLARKLGIAKSTIKADTKGSTILQIPSDRPYYLNGYEAIDEEMNLVKQRKDKSAFIEGLYEKEQVARSYEQDKEVEQLKMMVNLSDMNSDNFVASVIDYKSTQFKYESNRMLYLLIILVGAMTGALFVLISDAFQKRKKNS